MDEPGRFYRWDEIEIPEPKPITYREKKAIYERDGGRCYLCGDDVPYRKFPIAHVIPLHELDDIRNKAVVCNVCHVAMDGLDPLEYRLALSLNGMRWRDERYADLLREVSDED
jgi:5-methylcytosine-specific restriction endonuclease McrA